MLFKGIKNDGRQIGERVKIRFAFLPKRLSNYDVIFLEYYSITQKQHYSEILGYFWITVHKEQYIKK